MAENVKCSKTVYPREQWGMFHGHQCSRNAVKDGFCNLHHPDAISARDEAASARWHAKKKTEPLYLLSRARERIKELEDEVALLKSELKERTQQ